MQFVKISIIVPVYNVEKYLHRCVDSILNQTHKNLEVILVNDGSPDKSGEICDDYAKKDARIKVVHRENGGLSAARNSGLKVITGDYVSFVDSDDWIHPMMIKVMLNTLLKNNSKIVECDLISSLFAPPGYTSEDNLEIVTENRLEVLKRLIKNQRFSVCVRLYAKELLSRLAFPEGKNSEDVYFITDVYKQVEKNIRILFPFYTYFVNLEGITKMPYTLKKLDSLDAALFLKDNVENFYNDKALTQIIRENLLKEVLYHYKLLNYNSHLDKEWKLRKKMKQYITANYDKKYTNSINLKLAHYLPLSLFNLIIRLNKLRRINTIR
ncbi:glycosyltransferase [Flavobacteriaceae bacterium R38]|nr:glycosyltransferase [Flavobacteriaceae bacterium R38]